MGNKSIACERIKRVRDGEDEEEDFDSQDTVIHDLIEMDDDIATMNKHQHVISEKLDALVPIAKRLVDLAQLLLLLDGSECVDR